MKKTKVAPGNTAEEIKRDPIGFLAEAIFGGTSQAIDRQEARGQQDLVKSTTLPTDMNGSDKHEIKKILTKAGVKFLGPVEGDELFQYVELPVGWKKVATDHPMWSRLVDDKGRERATIFYKADFYDRGAHMNLSHRYKIEIDYDRQTKEKVAVAYVKDCGQVIFTTEPIKMPVEGDGRKGYEITDLATAAATKWLKKNFPDWENPGAYWD